MTPDERFSLTNSIDGVRENLVNAMRAHWHYTPLPLYTRMREVEESLELILRKLEDNDDD